jgi:cytochrome P450 family 142 subfamily A polypeptide 1
MTSPTHPVFNPFAVKPLKETRAALDELRLDAAASRIDATSVFVSRWEEVRNVLREPAAFSSRSNMLLDPSLPRFVTQLDPPDHTELRKILREGFDRAAIVRAAPWVETLAGALIDGIAAEGRAEVLSALAQPLTASVIARLVGIPEQDGPMLARWSLEITAMMPAPRFDGEEWRRIEDYVAARVRERRALDPGEEPADDMLTRLMTEKVGGRLLSDREVAFHTWLLYIGGLETTAYTLGMTLYQLLAVPERWERVVANRSLIPNAVEEGLRWGTALRFLQREAIEERPISGCPVHTGETVYVGLESANFDPAAFEDPESFDLDRPNSRRHVSFGYGNHLCLGATLARTELVTVLNCLADRLPGLRLAPGFDLETVDSPMFCGPKRLDVEW